MVVVLLAVAFFYSSVGAPAESLSKVFASPAECLQAKAELSQRLAADPRIEGAAIVCLQVPDQKGI